MGFGRSTPVSSHYFSTEGSQALVFAHTFCDVNKSFLV